MELEISIEEKNKNHDIGCVAWGCLDFAPHKIVVTELPLNYVFNVYYLCDAHKSDLWELVQEDLDDLKDIEGDRKYSISEEK